MVNPSSGLEALYERCLTWLRSPRLARSRRFGGHKVSEPSPTLESVDLVGGDHGTTNQPTTFGPHSATNCGTPAARFN